MLGSFTVATSKQHTMCSTHTKSVVWDRPDPILSFYFEHLFTTAEYNVRSRLTYTRLLKRIITITVNVVYLSMLLIFMMLYYYFDILY